MDCLFSVGFVHTMSVGDVLVVLQVTAMGERVHTKVYNVSR